MHRRGASAGVPSVARFRILTAPPILIVAKDDAECFAIEQLLRGVGPIESACSGGAALMRLGMTDFGCMVIASPIPVDFGTEPLTLMELLERLAPNLASRIIVVTDADEADVVERARDLGVHQLLLRPFEPDELRETVGRCLRHQAACAARETSGSGDGHLQPPPNA